VRRAWRNSVLERWMAIPHIPAQSQLDHCLRDTLKANLRLLYVDVGSSRGPLNTMNSGQLVLVTLQNPREKFWGVILSLTPAGLSLRGVDLESLEDFTQMVKLGEPASANVVFFPMHRVQRVEVDARAGELPSLSEQFAAKTGVNVNKYFQEPQ
jgi:hypothetical protein